MAKAMIKYDRNSIRKTWRDLAKISLDALEEYMGYEVDSMTTAFERDKVLRQMEDAIDRIRDADISA
jgi:hypothetical protein